MKQKVIDKQPENIPGFFLSHTERFVEDTKGNTDALWKSAGIKRDQFQPLQDMVNEDQLYAFILEALSQHPQGAFGLELGKKISFASYGLISRALMSCSNFRTATTLTVRYASLTLPLVQFSSRESNEHFILEIIGMSQYQELNQIIPEALLSNIIHTFQLLTGHELEIDRVSFAFPEPEYRDHFDKSIAKEFVFSANSNLIFIKQEYADLPFITSNVTDSELILAQCESDLIKTQKKKAFAEQVIEQIRDYLDTNPAATEMAQRFNMSERSLRRRLAEEGTSYRALLKNVREEMAKYYLMQTNLPIAQIALKLGYQEIANFRSAFKSWTGVAPSAWKNSQVSAASVNDSL